MTKERCPQGRVLQTALAWLRTNEGDDGEADACGSVANWLEQFAFDQEMKIAAREAGVPVAKVRQRVAQQQRGIR